MPQLTDLLRLLGDETRLRILHLLATEPLTVGELQELLDLSQSSVSGHLSRLKRAGFTHSVAEGSSHRYRLRADLQPPDQAAWRAIKELSASDPAVRTDAEGLQQLLASRGRSWVERVAGSLHRAYAPGRTWDALAHSFISLAELGVCIDVGAGDGSMLELLAPQSRQLICIDPSPAMRAAGERRIAAAGIANASYRQARGESLPLPEASCDTALLLQSLQYVDDPAATIGECLRVLRPGGRLLLLTLAKHRHQEARRYGHLHLGFDPAELRRWCEAGLQRCDLRQLPPESRSPRFASILLCGRRA